MMIRCVINVCLEDGEDGEFPLLIKEQRDYHEWFKVYFRMSVAQIDALLAILEPYLKRRPQMSVNSVYKDLYSALCCETKWMNLTIANLDFGVCLYGGSELSKHLSKCLLRMRKSRTSIDWSNFFFWWTKILEAVCKCDWQHEVVFIFQRVKMSDSVCNGL